MEGRGMDAATETLLYERHAALPRALDDLKATCAQVIAAWDDMPERKRRECSMQFWAAMHGLIMAIEENEGERRHGDEHEHAEAPAPGVHASALCQGLRDVSTRRHQGAADRRGHLATRVSILQGPVGQDRGGARRAADTWGGVRARPLQRKETCGAYASVMVVYSAKYQKK